MSHLMNQVEAIPRQLNIERLDKDALCKFARHEHVAANANTLPSDYCFNGMELFPEAQVIHLVEFGHVAPLGACGCKPSLPGGSFGVHGKPIAMNQRLTPEVRCSLEAAVG